MSDEQVQEQSETQLPLIDEDELWASTPEEGTEVEEVSAPQEEAKEEVQAEPEPEVQNEVVEPSEAVTEDTQEVKTEEHDFEKRYNDLRPEFNKKLQELDEVAKENERLRLERLELLQRTSNTPEVKEEEKPDPDSDENYYSETDRELMEEFPELTGWAKKMAEREIRRAVTKQQEALDKVNQQFEEQQRQQYLTYHRDYMHTHVSDQYLEIDKDPEFHKFVQSTPIYHQAMTQSIDPRDHSHVMNVFLNTEAGKKWSKQPEVTSESQQSVNTAIETKKNTAMGLVSGSAPVIEKRTQDLTDKELWDSIPDQTI